MTDGDVTLNESRVIAAYLVNKFEPNSSLYGGEDNELKAKIDEMLLREENKLFKNIIPIVVSCSNVGL